jgi:hypothetical protein
MVESIDELRGRQVRLQARMLLNDEAELMCPLLGDFALRLRSDLEVALAAVGLERQAVIPSVRH